MSNILNVDALKVSRMVTLNGRDRKLNSMTVDQFIESEEFEERFKSASPSDQINMLVDKILEHIEDTTRDELLKLDMTQLMAVLAFIRGKDISSQIMDEAQKEVKQAQGEPTPKLSS